MCGITGIYNFNKQPVTRRLIKEMTDVIYHRGPNDEGQYVDDFVGLGHRRLSIIDLSSAGHQPMSNEDKKVWIVYNGEIYNFKELKSQLENKGHVFKSNTDTEVIIHLYEEYGEDCVPFLHGMFAFAIWDSRGNKLILCRDRLGIKPLYYWFDGKTFVFGSEIKSILKHPEVKRGVNLQGIYNHLMYRFSPSNETVFKGILKLSPGHILVFNNGNVVIKQYWDLIEKIALHERLNEALYVDKVYNLFSEKTSSHLISDVPLGAFLSGGLDSSSIVGVMSAHLQEPVKTYSVGFGVGGNIDEINFARESAEYFKADYNELICTSCTLELLEKVIWHLEEPIFDAAVIPTFLVAQLAAKDVRVVLTGEGSDEVNGGYAKYLKDYRYGDIISLYGRLPTFIRKFLNRRFFLRSRRFFRDLQVLNEGRFYEAKKFSYLSCPFWSGIREKDLISPELRNTIDNKLNSFQAILDSAKIDKDLRFFYLDLKTWLPDDLLLKVDKMTMAHSLEARVPYLDHEYVEFVLSIPAYLKFKGDNTKYLFRQAARKIVPERIIQRRQHGFNVPLNMWFNGELRDFIWDILTDARTKARGYFNNEYIYNMLDTHFNRGGNFTRQIWRILMLELWHRIYID